MTANPPTACPPRAVRLHPREAWLPSMVVGLLAMEALVHTTDVREVGGNPATPWWIAGGGGVLIALAALVLPGTRADCPENWRVGDA